MVEIIAGAKTIDTNVAAVTGTDAGGVAKFGTVTMMGVSVVIDTGANRASKDAVADAVAIGASVACGIGDSVVGVVVGAKTIDVNVSVIIKRGIIYNDKIL